MNKRKCSNCKKIKPEEEFAWRSKVKGTRSYSCKECMKAASKASYRKNRDHYVTNRVKRTRGLSKFNSRLIQRYKRLKGCCVCGYNKCTDALDLHHLDATTKDKMVSKLYRETTKRLKIEVRKCVVVCATCHREIHAGVAQLELRR
ncbi:MAG: hypothetical protein V2I33_04730 [Kangiellaceae bacterium]|nr:hypothetical protein [Kangiellaceae bacterium]